MEFCLLAAGAIIRLGTAALTLAWTHSVQKTRWEEDWRIQSGMMQIAESRIEGTGAGMEPGQSATFDGKWWRWKPDMQPLKETVLRRSGATADWQVCIEGQCKPMSAYVAEDADPVTLTVCGKK
jgi:hypothetical protein